MSMKTGAAGLNLIKTFEGCRLKAYKCVSTEKYHTIGYGHYGADVAANMTITQEQAETYLKSDLAKFEGYVNSTGMQLDQNQFDALVSFTYNCGQGNLKKLIQNRTAAQIADALLLYNKSGGKVLAGLTRRRTAEKELFLSSNKTTLQAAANEEPTAGAYILISKMKVRTGAGTNYPQKKKSELSANAQQFSDATGCLLAGTNVTVKKVVKNGSDYWALIPSGYVCMRSGNNIYMKKS